MSMVAQPELNKDKISKAFFAALVASLMNPQCSCKTCLILRKIAKELLGEFEKEVGLLG